MKKTSVRRSRLVATVLSIVLGVSALVGMSATPALAVVSSCADSACPDPTGWSTARWSAHAGYPSNGGVVDGANCTNYAAWRLMNNGLAENSLRGLGNASTWATRAQADGFVVDHAAAVGAIAQWNSNHVAYVEQVNGDGTIVVSESNVYTTDYNVRMWLHHRTVASASVSNFIHFGGSPSSGSNRLIATGDFDGDGHVDLLGIRPDSSLKLYTGNGSGSWINGSGTTIGGGWLAFKSTLSPGDFNGDGFPDVIAVDTSGALKLYTGNGAGGWVNGSGVTIGGGFASMKAVLAPGDFNGDGFPDIIGVLPDGSLKLYTGNGSGGWINGGGISIGGGFSSAYTMVAPGDFNGDGKPDMIVVWPDGTMKLYTGNGTGGWINGSGITIGGGFGTVKEIVGPGDFSGDGFADLITIRSDGTMWLYTGNGAGGWVNGSGVQIGGGW